MARIAALSAAVWAPGSTDVTRARILSCRGDRRRGRVSTVVRPGRTAIGRSDPAAIAVPPGRQSLISSAPRSAACRGPYDYAKKRGAREMKKAFATALVVFGVLVAIVTPATADTSTFGYTTAGATSDAGDAN